MSPRPIVRRPDFAFDANRIESITALAFVDDQGVKHARYTLEGRMCHDGFPGPICQPSGTLVVSIATAPGLRLPIEGSTYPVPKYEAKYTIAR